nr:MAG TPA: hypothetical protein [Caudoviricetes sp.]
MPGFLCLKNARRRHEHVNILLNSQQHKFNILMLQM